MYFISKGYVEVYYLWICELDRVLILSLALVVPVAIALPQLCNLKILRDICLHAPECGHVEIRSDSVSR